MAALCVEMMRLFDLHNSRSRVHTLLCSPAMFSAAAVLCHTSPGEATLICFLL